LCCETALVTIIAEATTDDVEFMWQMLYYASHTNHEDGVTIADMQRNPDLIRHLDAWGTRKGDLGLIARTPDHRPIGACWLRHMVAHEQQDVTFVDDVTPELVISVEPDMTGSGIGSQLLAQILPLADESGVSQIVLTARASNPAVALYERHDFVLVERITNRVGTKSVKMLRQKPVS
jgi:ribosomal protein S18 acetylase RimI-like enzyme